MFKSYTYTYTSIVIISGLKRGFKQAMSLSFKPLGLTNLPNLDCVVDYVVKFILLVRYNVESILQAWHECE